jgi:hypothetical protein
MNRKKALALFTLAFAFTCIGYIWVSYSPSVAVYRLIHNRDTEADLAFAFTTALITNHPDAYYMITPGLKLRLDEWMNIHQSKRCGNLPDLLLVGSDTNNNYNISFSCNGVDANGWIDFAVENIVIKDMKVIDWGKVEEGN